MALGPGHAPARRDAGGLPGGDEGDVRPRHDVDGRRLPQRRALHARAAGAVHRLRHQPWGAPGRGGGGGRDPRDRPGHPRLDHPHPAGEGRGPGGLAAPARPGVRPRHDGGGLGLRHGRPGRPRPRGVARHGADRHRVRRARPGDRRGHGAADGRDRRQRCGRRGRLRALRRRDARRRGGRLDAAVALPPGPGRGTLAGGVPGDFAWLVLGAATVLAVAPPVFARRDIRHP